MRKKSGILEKFCIFAPMNMKKGEKIMEERKFKNRTERLLWLDAQRGWGPLTEEEKAILDDAVRLVTNLDSKPRYAVSY